MITAPAATMLAIICTHAKANHFVTVQAAEMTDMLVAGIIRALLDCSASMTLVPLPDAEA
jgi:hypothetical protein